MLVTPEEALDMKCPELLVAEQRGIEDVFCHGPTCMGWRWYDNKQEKGYCGRAGNPRTFMYMPRDPGPRIIE